MVNHNGESANSVLITKSNSLSSNLETKEIMITILSNVLSFSVALFVFGFDIKEIKR